LSFRFSNIGFLASQISSHGCQIGLNAQFIGADELGYDSARVAPRVARPYATGFFHTKGPLRPIIIVAPDPVSQMVRFSTLGQFALPEADFLSKAFPCCPHGNQGAGLP